jgi:hypothetical protein
MGCPALELDLSTAACFPCGLLTLLGHEAGFCGMDCAPRGRQGEAPLQSASVGSQERSLPTPSAPGQGLPVKPDGQLCNLRARAVKDVVSALNAAATSTGRADVWRKFRLRGASVRRRPTPRVNVGRGSAPTSYPRRQRRRPQREVVPSG